MINEMENTQTTQITQNIKKYIVGIIGIGILGNAIKNTFESIPSIELLCYDKYKEIDNNNNNNNNKSTILDMNKCDIIFVCLPTEYDEVRKEFDKTEIYNVCDEIATNKYKGIIVLKSTIEPETTKYISKKYEHLPLTIIHNPEFLSARTASEDFKNQNHIVLGFPTYTNLTNPTNPTNTLIKYLETFFNLYFPLAKISICSSTESESMKLLCNSFYATKIQFFTETKLLCDKLEIEYDNVKELMLNNGWINPNHTQIPGHDGNISYGGKCFPKDIKALNQVFIKHDVTHKVIESVIEENKTMR